MKVAVLGAAGGIGQALALLLKLQLPAESELALYDIAPVTPGVAKDVSHIPTAVKVEGFAGEDPTPALKGADVVLISAGVARKPGMDRSDLFNINAGIVRNLIEHIAKTCPKACVGIITNPVNTTVAIAAEVLKKAGVYDKRKLFGVTTLDVLRSETFVSELKGLNDTEMAIIDKRRPRANVSQVMHIIGDVADRDCILVDDMIDTGGTLCKAADALKERGAKRVFAYATHAVFSGAAAQHLASDAIDEIVVTDTVPLSPEMKALGKVRVLTLSTMLAEAIRRISNEESISAMFE